MVSIKHCWEPAPRTLHHQRDNGPTTHVISYLDKLAVCHLTCKAWDELVWPSTAATLQVPTKAKPCGYCWGQAVDLGPVMLAAQFWVANEWGTYLCTTGALVFKGKMLAYNPALSEAEWIPARGLANDLSWGKERSAVSLANYILCMQREEKRIAGLGVSRVVSSLDDDMSTTSMEEEEESWFSDVPSMGPWMDMNHEVDLESEGAKRSEEGVSGGKILEEGGEASAPGTDSL